MSQGQAFRPFDLSIEFVESSITTITVFLASSTSTSSSFVELDDLGRRFEAGNSLYIEDLLISDQVHLEAYVEECSSRLALLYFCHDSGCACRTEADERHSNNPISESTQSFSDRGVGSCAARC